MNTSSYGPIVSRLFIGKMALLSALIALTTSFSGCNAPATYRLRSDAEAKAASLHTVAIAPVDAELSELTAGGVLEKRDD